MRANPTVLTGWGRTRRAAMSAWRPERGPELDDALAAIEGPVIARGAGRSYGDAAINDGGAAVMTTRLDRMLAFDPGSGELVCEPGVTFRDLLDAFTARSFMPPASPGTAFATVGGAVAADVHGKNHDRHGSFGDAVRWIELLLADGTTRRVSAAEDPELFRATIGGMGLTGIVRRIAVAMLPGAAPMVRVRERAVRDLDDHIAGLIEARARSTFSVGWIDALATGAQLGRGVLETAEFAPGESPAPAPRRRAVPIDLPGFVLNTHAVRAFNTVYAARVPASGREVLRRFDVFLYPLDAIHAWNRIYGKAGFYQFQCVIPDAEAPRAIRAMLERIAAAGSASFLAVLKTLGREGRGLLSFPMPGITLALDFPRRPGVEALIGGLNRLAAECGGRVYLAKDALLTPGQFRAMYPQAEAFGAVLARVDPSGRFVSDLARRLAIRPGGGP
ncbi:MAG: FAD-binding oxidoreductase [Alphaproteobacteria bacterium]|nr:FAD-binding oxidoreductase [Alphaproteobacteria bacterium]